MKISHLSRQSGVPVATIKFYLREGLLPPGIRTARNQACYAETHLERLRLIRVLTELGTMSLASVREVLSAIDTGCSSPHKLAMIVKQALAAEQPERTDSRAEVSARGRVDEFIGGLGWSVESDAQGRATLARVLTALSDLGWECETNVFTPYANVAEKLAVHALETEEQGTATTIVARTVLFEVAFAAMRRMAYAHYLKQASAFPSVGSLASGRRGP